MKNITTPKDFFNIRILMLLFLTFLSLMVYSSFFSTHTEKIAAQEISLEPYCKNGYYEIPNEPICSRAPGCGGYDYDSLNNSSKMPNAQQCMGEGSSGRAEKGCAGYVPLCCYEVARTGDFTKCIGYWERLWCTKSQCDTAKSRGASDSQCGGSCQCGHAFDSYCGAKDPVPLSQRLQGGGGNTPAPTNAAPTPTSAPNPTSVPQANCPSSSSRSYDQIDVSGGDGKSAKDHADKNIQVRGYQGTGGTRNLIHNNGPKDSKAPQLSTVLSNRTPAIVSMYQVYDWNWGSNSKGSLLTDPWEVTMIGLSANPGDSVRVPDSGYSIGSGFEAVVLYAASDTITLEYTREDSVAHGYAIQYDGICVDPNLVKLYNDLNGKGRGKLPALKGTQTIGTAKTNEVKVAVRDTGTYMDPRSDDSWWIGISSLPNAPGVTSAPSQPTATPGGPTVTPGGPTATPGGSNPTATPKPGSCSTATTPIFVTKQGAGAYPGKIRLQWNATPGTKRYAIRIDDMTNGWKGDCSVTQFPGDVCVDSVSGSATSYEFTGVEAHTYHYWIHSINYCGEWSKAKDQIITVPPVGTASTCNIQGYRTLQNDKYSNNIFPPDEIKLLTISATGGTVINSYQNNPYFLKVEGGKTYTVTAPELLGYTISSTSCINNIGCHDGTLTNPTLENGNSRTVTCPAGGYVDLWWHYLPSSVPTLSVPRPTATPGGANLTPTVPAATDTPVQPTPTPSPCPVISALEWKPGENHYTRTVISYDGVNVIENISLHLKQITQSGLVVQVSTDGGTTWAPSDSSQDDDHFVTIKNRHTEVINLKVRLLNSCQVTSPELSESVQPVPLPSISVKPTNRPSATPGSSPMVPALIVGGAALTVAAIAIFFFGI